MTTAKDAIEMIEQVRDAYRNRILSGAVANSQQSLESRMVAYRAAVNVYVDLGSIAAEMAKRLTEEEREDSLPVTDEKKDPYEEEDFDD